MKQIPAAFWKEYLENKFLIIALCVGLLVHGAVVYFTLPQTYDGYVHLFFADHYARFWFEPWDYRWYTGFLTISYPPLTHQVIALLGKVIPLKIAYCLYAISIYGVLILGIFRFSRIFFCAKTAGIAALVTVVFGSLTQTLHVYGQLPTLTGLAFLLHALPFLYRFIKTKDWTQLMMTLVLTSVVVSSHHVTVIFGMVFFIAPTILMALIDANPNLERAHFFKGFIPQLLGAAWKKRAVILAYGSSTSALTLCLILPYWYWNRTDPITQVSIPHGSRDNFLEVSSSGLLFYVIPLLIVFAFLPAILYLMTSQKRHIGWLVSFLFCLLLGSGGTTPLPRLLLGETAFSILTLDRFGFWASILSIPYLSHFLASLLGGELKTTWILRIGRFHYSLLIGLSGISYLIFLLYVIHLGSFRSLQPKSVEIEPILNFLHSDDHMRWRYLTLGFGDQMAWLSANTLAATVDGNYHSARRLPEMTSRAVERLENAKYLKEDGMASLKDFLTNSEKYQLKFIFSKDHFYDPLLFYTGWTRALRLTNGVVVWEKGNISTIQPIRPKPLHPALKIAWGILPLSSLLLTGLVSLLYVLVLYKPAHSAGRREVAIQFPKVLGSISSWIPLLIFTLFLAHRVYELIWINEQKDPETTIQSHYQNLDFQRFEDAFRFFKPSPEYSLNQFLLERSVLGSGLLPSFGKLRNVSLDTLNLEKKSARMRVSASWNTALGMKTQSDTLDLERIKNNWYILPPKQQTEIPEEQLISHSYTLFKKMGKRAISSFPVVRDDRIKKPFAGFYQVNLVEHQGHYRLTGELINADNIPINVALKASITVENNRKTTFYPKEAMQYNLAPKASTWFQIDLGIPPSKIISISLEADTDVSERGYIRGGVLRYALKQTEPKAYHLQASMYNPFTFEITIPGLLIAEKDPQGRILQVALWNHTRSIQSGLSGNLTIPVTFQQEHTQLITGIPIMLWINNQKRELLPTQKKSNYHLNKGIEVLPHCFFAQEIYLQ